MVKKKYFISILVLVVFFVAGCSPAGSGQSQQSGPQSGSQSGTQSGSQPGTTADSGDGAAVSDIAAAYPGVFDVLDPDYNRYNDFVQTDNGVIYYNKNYSGIYLEDPVTGQSTPIVTDCIIPHFIIHGGYIYYCVMQKPYLFRVSTSGGTPSPVKTNNGIDISGIKNMGVIKDTLYMTISTGDSSGDSPSDLSYSADITGDPDVLTLNLSNVNGFKNIFDAIGLPGSNGLYYRCGLTPNHIGEDPSFDLYIQLIDSDKLNEIISGIYGINYFITNKYIFYYYFNRYQTSATYDIMRAKLDGSEAMVFLKSPDSLISFTAYEDNWVYFVFTDSSGAKIDSLYRFNQDTGESHEIKGWSILKFNVANNCLYGYDFNTNDMARMQFPD